ncbi:MAG: phosphotransferase [Pseudohongiellaceae bacterium]
MTQLTDWLKTPVELPESVMHGDLFLDNALFDGDHISGGIDFYNAATGWDLLDLAIYVNDWCIDETSNEIALDRDRIHALLSAYSTQRALTPPGNCMLAADVATCCATFLGISPAIRDCSQGSARSIDQ